MYTIKVSRNLTSSTFYNNIIPKLHEYFYKKLTYMKIEFDFSDTTYIEPSVLPNLANVGAILYKELGEMALLSNIVNTNVSLFLFATDFLMLCDKYKLFKHNKNEIAGQTPEQTAKASYYSPIFYAQSKSDKDFIYYLVEKSFNKALMLAFDVSKEETESYNEQGQRYWKYIKGLSEIIHNACEYSTSHCMYTWHYYKKTDKLSMSISDSGIGFFDAINNQIEENERKRRQAQKEGKEFEFTDKIPKLKLLDSDNKFNPDYNNLVGILAGLLWRKESEIYGLYHVVNEMIGKGAIITIHSFNTKLVINKKTWERINEDEDQLISMLHDGDISRLTSSSADVISRYKFAGVHIEIELRNLNSEQEK